MKAGDLKEAKLACRVAGTWDAQAQLFEHTIRADHASFTAWHGVIDIACTEPEAGRLWMQVVRLDLEDGRAGFALCLDVATRIDLITPRGEVPGQTVLVYFVGISTLDRADAVKGPDLPVPVDEAT